MSYRIDPGLPFGQEIRRIADEEICAVLTVLTALDDGHHRALHGARKRLKRLRGLLRLVREGDAGFFRRENARYRDVARSLATARDAGALVETVERFMAEAADVAVVRDLALVREALVRRRDRLMREAASAGDGVPAAIRALEEGREALAQLALPAGRKASARLVAGGVGDTFAGARKSLKRARKGTDPEHFHDLRKAVKYHWMHLGLVGGLWPGKTGRRRQAMKALGERLGELNDIDVMRAVMAAEGEAIATPGHAAVFLGLLERKEATLRAECLAEAGRLFDGASRKRAAALAPRYRKAALSRPAAQKPAPRKPALADA